MEKYKTRELMEEALKQTLQKEENFWSLEVYGEDPEKWETCVVCKQKPQILHSEFRDYRVAKCSCKDKDVLTRLPLHKLREWWNKLRKRELPVKFGF